MNKFEKLLIENKVNKHDYIDNLKLLKKQLTIMIKDYEELDEKEFNKTYPRCDYTFQGLCYYRRLVTKKIRVLKELYNND